MKCFIHNGEEAIAACRKCGKGMCANCSAYSGHSGICPECRRDEFVAEMRVLENNIKETSKAIVMKWVWGILLCWTIIAPIYQLITGISLSKEKTKMQERYEKLRKEVDRLNKILVRRGGPAFT